MTFKSVGRRSDQAFIKFRRIKAGTTGGFISVNAGLRKQRVEIQIDENTRQIRIKEGVPGYSVTASGTFTCERKVFDMCGAGKIFLTTGEDDWLYGSLDNKSGGKNGR